MTGFYRTQGRLCHQLRNEKLHIRHPLVTSYERQEFSTDWQIYRLINCSFGQTWKKTWNLYFQWRHCTLGQQCGNLKSSIKAPPTMQTAVIKQQSSALLIVCERIHLWAVDSPHTVINAKGIKTYWWLTPSIYDFTSIFFRRSLPEGVFPHSVSTWRDPCVRVCAPLTLASPSRENKTEQRWHGSPLEPSEGEFELTHGSACIIWW